MNLKQFQVTFKDGEFFFYVPGHDSGNKTPFTPFVDNPEFGSPTLAEIQPTHTWIRNTTDGRIEFVRDRAKKSFPISYIKFKLSGTFALLPSEQPAPLLGGALADIDAAPVGIKDHPQILAAIEKITAAANNIQEG